MDKILIESFNINPSWVKNQLHDSKPGKCIYVMIQHPLAGKFQIKEDGFNTYWIRNNLTGRDQGYIAPWCIATLTDDHKNVRCRFKILRKFKIKEAHEPHHIQSWLNTFIHLDYAELYDVLFFVPDDRINPQYAYIITPIHIDKDEKWQSKT
jgi:hypothetical protein